MGHIYRADVLVADIIGQAVTRTADDGAFDRFEHLVQFPTRRLALDVHDPLLDRFLHEDRTRMLFVFFVNKSAARVILLRQ